MESSTEPPAKKRRRPPLACEACRRRKVKCDRKSPCDNCVRTKRASQCTYVLEPDPTGRNQASHGHGSSSNSGLVDENGVTQNAGVAFTFGIPVESVGPYSESDQSASQPTPITNFLTHSTSVRGGLSPPLSHPSNDGPAGNPLTERVRQLEQQLAQLRQKTKPQRSAPAPKPKGLLLKTRYVGQSHWMNGARLYPLLTTLIKRIESDKTSVLFQSLCTCKSLAKAIKNTRVPSMVSINFGQHIPSRATADQLIDAYLRTFETVYRILHVPSFKREYSAYWNNPTGASQAFIIQLQLCMAVGACFLDDKFSHRHLATQWIYEAQFWYIQPGEKSRMNLQGLQTLCLLYLARETCAIGADLVWISVGNLARAAMFMGFHRDPDHLPRMSPYLAEMRRRLWVTILELLVASSLDSGCPPLIGAKDFDTKPPSNFNDEDLDSMDERSTPTPKPMTVFTDTSIQIILYRSFQTRLSVARFLNEFDAMNSYDETLRLNAALTTACRGFSATLQKFQSPTDAQTRHPSRFQVRLAEQSLHRIFLALHLPWLPVAEHDPRYYFSRKLCIETALRLYKGMVVHRNTPSTSATLPSPLASLDAQPFSTQTSEQDDFLRLLICGCGAYRTVPVQCFFTIGLELVWQLEEDRDLNTNIEFSSSGDDAIAEGFGGMSGVPSSSTTGVRVMGTQAVQESELIEAARYAVGWTKARVLAGETNVKGYLFVGSLFGQVEALQRGASDEEVEKVVVDLMEVSVKECVDLLKTMATNEGSLRSGNGAASTTGPSLGPNGEQVSDGVGFETGTPGLGSGSVSDWDWDEMLQDGEASYNFNFQGLDLVFGDI